MRRLLNGLNNNYMKVAFIHDWLTGMRGGEKVLEVFCELFPDAHLYTLLHIKGSVSQTIENMDIRTSFLQRLPFIEKRYRYFLPLFPAAIERFDLSDYNLIVSTSHCVAKGVIPSPYACHISYIHTPMRYIWDMYHEYFGKNSSLILKICMPFFANYLRMWDVSSSARVDYFVANSRHVASRIKRYYNREAKVICPPVDTERFMCAKEKGDYYLIVSSFAPYKRLELAIDAFNRLRLPLKVVGKGQDEKKLKNMAGKCVEFLGWKSDEELKEFYRGCKAIIFPGEEDFGIVPVEAMACGRPVIAYGRGGVIESVIPLNPSGKRINKGESPTGVFFYEQTVDALVDAVGFFEKNQAEFDSREISKNAQRFGRERFKEEIKDFIDRSVGEWKNKMQTYEGIKC